jgi:hypothetical protein
MDEPRNGLVNGELIWTFGDWEVEVLERLHAGV